MENMYRTLWIAERMKDADTTGLHPLLQILLALLAIAGVAGLLMVVLLLVDYFRHWRD